MITANLVTIVGTAVVTIGGLIPVLRAHAKSIGKAIVNNAKPIAMVANDAVQVVEDVAKLPALAEMKIKLNDAESKLRVKEIATIAGAALHAYERGFNGLSQNEKGTLLTLVRAEVAKVYPDVTDQEIIAALKDTQGLADVFKGTEAYKATIALENSLKSLTQSVQNQATAPVQTV
jgi:hypothetical protein